MNMRIAIVFVFCSLIINYIDSEQLWYDNMDTGDEWLGTGYASMSSSNCDSSNCAYLQQNSWIQYDGLNTTNYEKIQLRYSIKPNNFESGDSCTVLYSVDQTNWFILNQYDYNDNGIKYSQETVNMSKNADDQNNLSIRFESVTSGADQCYIDELYLFGTKILITSSPTSAPTQTVAASPTNNPTSDPTMDPTGDPAVDPTNDPTSNPTADPTIDPTNDPTIDPTNDPTSDPTNDPTIEPTIDPTIEQTMAPTRAPSISPTVSPTNYNIKQTIAVVDTSNSKDDADGNVQETTKVNIDIDTDDKPKQPSVFSDDYLLNNWYYLVAAGVILLCLLSVVILCCMRKEKLIHKNKKQKQMVKKDIMSISVTNTMYSRNETNENEIEMAEIQISFPSIPIEAPQSMPSSPRPIAPIIVTPMELMEYENDNNNIDNIKQAQSIENNPRDIIPVIMTPGLDGNVLNGGEIDGIYDFETTKEEDDADELYEDITDEDGQNVMDEKDGRETAGNTMGRSTFNPETVGANLMMIHQDSEHINDEYEYYYEDEKEDNDEGTNELYKEDENMDDNMQHNVEYNNLGQIEPQIASITPQ